MTNSPSRSNLRHVFFALEAILATFFVGVSSAYSQGTGVYAKFLRNPDLVNVAYGPDSRNVLDLWKAPSPMATPLVIYIHGGGFSSGSKERLSPILLKRCLEKGISVGAINYRLSNTAPYPAATHDGARAVQFFRAKSAEWNLDPNAIGATGGSAGGTLSLWLCFHDDLADFQSTDPVARQSTRLAAAATQSAPTTLVPSRMENIAGTLASQHPFMEHFIGAKMSEWNIPAIQQRFEDASPDTHLSKDDPPAFLYHSGPWKLPENPNAGQAIHATAFGVHLKESADKIGARVSIRQIDEYPVKADWEDALAIEMVEFFTLAFR